MEPEQSGVTTTTQPDAVGFFEHLKRQRQETSTVRKRPQTLDAFKARPV
jgi:hypothetical protein